MYDRYDALFRAVQRFPHETNLAKQLIVLADRIGKDRTLRRRLLSSNTTYLCDILEENWDSKRMNIQRVEEIMPENGTLLTHIQHRAEVYLQLPQQVSKLQQLSRTRKASIPHQFLPYFASDHLSALLGETENVATFQKSTWAGNMLID